MLAFLNLLDLPLDWNEKLNFFLILFSAGLLCLLCAILLAYYLIKSDRFASTTKIKSKFSRHPSSYRESRLSRIKNEVRSFFSAFMGIFKRSKVKFDDYSYEDFKQTPETPPEEESVPPPETPPEEESDTAKKEH